MNRYTDKEILKARAIIRQKIADGEEMTKKWAYVMVCDTMEQVDKLLKEDHLIEASKNGTLTRDELQELCDLVYGKDTMDSRLVFLTLIKNNKINSGLSQDEQKELYELTQKAQQRSIQRI